MYQYRARSVKYACLCVYVCDCLPYTSYSRQAVDTYSIYVGGPIVAETSHKETRIRKHTYINTHTETGCHDKLDEEESRTVIVVDGLGGLRPRAEPR